VGAQPQPPGDNGREQEVDAKIRAFFDALSRGNSIAAFDELLRQSPFGSADAVQAQRELRNKVDELSIQFGVILNYEECDTKRIGKDIIVARYILKYENAPVIWSFAFYRKPVASTSITNTNAWTFVQLHFDTDLRFLL